MTNNFEDRNFVPIPNFQTRTWNETGDQVIEQLKRLTEAVNAREIGTFYAIEQLAGKQFVPSGTQNVPRAVYRTVLDVGALKDFTSAPVPNDQTIAHGISVNANTRIIHMYGGATNPSNEFIPLPFVDADAKSNDIELRADSTNVYLRSSIDYSAFTSAFIILEYIKEA